MKFRMPLPDVVVIDVRTGKFTADGYDAFKRLETLGLLDMTDVAPTNGQVLIFNATTGKYVPGAN